MERLFIEFQVASDHIQSFLLRRAIQRLSFCQLPGLLKNPRVTHCSTANHYPVTLRQFPHFSNIFRAGYVTIANHRNIHSLFDSGNERPVRRSRKSLLCCTRMNGYGIRTRILCNSGHLRDVDLGLTPAGSSFHRNRNTHSLSHCINQHCHCFWIPKEGSACTLAHYFRHRTSHVQIDDVGPLIRNNTRSFCHYLGI